MVFSLRGFLAAGKAIARDQAARLRGLVDSPSSDDAPSLLRAADRPETSLNGRTNEQRRTLLQRELRMALMARRIVVHYQPVIAFEDDRVIRFEARPRWNSDNQGWVERDPLMALAEDVGLITELDDQLLSQACLDARTWPEQVALAVRLSPIHLRDPMLGPRILTMLSNTGMSPHRLQLEFTESALGEPNEVSQRVMSQLRRVGIKIALDDFGTGYASLTQLLRFQFDRIKMDPRFIDQLDKDDDCAIIVRSIIRLANEFGIVVTAQGIKSAEQIKILIASGCQEGQGPFFGKPVSVSEIPFVLDRIKSVRPSHQIKPIC
jgi:EAL domain-containing protein (putative c-di-GMP-specific phosphodiesterase class I)